VPGSGGETAGAATTTGAGPTGAAVAAAAGFAWQWSTSSRTCSKAGQMRRSPPRLRSERGSSCPTAICVCAGACYWGRRRRCRLCLDLVRPAWGRRCGGAGLSLSALPCTDVSWRRCCAAVVAVVNIMLEHAHTTAANVSMEKRTVIDASTSLARSRMSILRIMCEKSRKGRVCWISVPDVHNSCGIRAHSSTAGALQRLDCLAQLVHLSHRETRRLTPGSTIV
jgi:hypothetical protein